MKKLFFVLILSSFTAFAQSSFEFLRINESARIGALGGTFTANNDDPDAIFYNPAGLSLLAQNPVSLSFTDYLVDIKLASLSASTAFEGIGRFGAAVKYINYGDFTGADDNGLRTGEFSAYDMAVILGYANQIDENFYFGVNAKYIFSKLEEYNSSAIAADLGLQYVFPEQKFVIAAATLNLGGQISSYSNTKEYLPVDVRVGISKELAHIPLRFSIDFQKLNEDAESFFSRFSNFSLGGEFSISKAVKLRVGYNNERRKELKVGTFSGLAGFNGGIGITISNYRFDYGYSPMGLVGDIHRISLATSF